ncbi:hypothetical protein GCM10023194_42940 [Planotetraspora phitsanulokensis]|uniref:Uncharacterized protein n=1 Tax=Planotetraspora phitsanulokensis TaxID=575192 RepID=A0A8J3XF58_9ACTN|nr:hypothetical protein [Planotetraspora phitsanulokensis]GII37896.1 hypothetical protein Pph01_28990 [Planotetraspora phitsanulokensis]
MDANSQGAAGLLRALLRTAALFTETGRSVSQDHFPHVRWMPVSDLGGHAVRLGLELELLGHELVFEIRAGLEEDRFTIEGDLVLDGELVQLALPPAATADVGRFVSVLDRYAEELTEPARAHVGALVESFAREA